jgi:hypothetical protein
MMCGVSKIRNQFYLRALLGQQVPHHDVHSSDDAITGRYFVDFNLINFAPKDNQH